MQLMPRTAAALGVDDAFDPVRTPTPARATSAGLAAATAVTACARLRHTTLARLGFRSRARSICRRKRALTSRTCSAAAAPRPRRAPSCRAFRIRAPSTRTASGNFPRVHPMHRHAARAPRDRPAQVASTPPSVRASRTHRSRACRAPKPRPPRFRPMPATSSRSDLALEVAVIWGEQNVLHVEHLSPPRAFWVGEEAQLEVRAHRLPDWPRESRHAAPTRRAADRVRHPGRRAARRELRARRRVRTRVARASLRSRIGWRRARRSRTPCSSRCRSARPRASSTRVRVRAQVDAGRAARSRATPRSSRRCSRTRGRSRRSGVHLAVLGLFYMMPPHSAALSFHIDNEQGRHPADRADGRGSEPLEEPKFLDPDAAQDSGRERAGAGCAAPHRPAAQAQGRHAVPRLRPARTGRARQPRGPRAQRAASSRVLRTHGHAARCSIRVRRRARGAGRPARCARRLLRSLPPDRSAASSA